MRTLAVIAMGLLCMGFSCKQKNKDKDCKDVMCTLMFAAVTVKVTHTDNSPVKLDKHYTVNVSNNDTIFSNNIGSPEEGMYTVLDDSYLQNMYNSTKEFLFIGMIGNSVVVNEPYTISADCCHVEKVSGKSSVIAK